MSPNAPHPNREAVSGTASSSRTPCVAFDALGAERGPAVVVEGVRIAAAEGIRVRVHGRADDLSGLDGVPGVELADCSGVIGNDDEPVRAVRSRPDASIVRAATDVVEGRADALASPGSTGATMAASLFALKRLKGVQRPALAVQLPTPGRDRPLILLDVGANADARPGHLVQFAYLGSAFVEAVLGIPSPRVALLSVGAEAKKGSTVVVDAHAAPAELDSIDFVGNVEGRELLDPPADVVVTDGFTGNVVLKTVEGTASAVGDAVREAARSGPRAMAGGLLLRPALGGLRESMDPDGTGGAILLGLRGIAVVGHGSSGALGIANQIGLAARSVTERAAERTAELIEAAGVGRAAMRAGDAGRSADES